MKPIRNLLRKAVITLLAFIIYGNCGYAQLTVTPGQTAVTLATTLAGPGVVVLNPVLTCPSVANGTFSFTGPVLSMSGGIILTNGHAAAAAGPDHH